MQEYDDHKTYTTCGLENKTHLNALKAAAGMLLSKLLSEELAYNIYYNVIIVHMMK